ncbi:unnamed protein product [Brachionus calyciflorus]|uniref:Uncharacterized protein n=1 Tax=Brachionus calyciflorus TaxID=104777 RepID=A0A813PKI4_9BILA|nr:unnamed protein product [Brachionus calyciflorus]
MNESRLNRAINESDTRESDTESELVIQRRENELVENLETMNKIQTNSLKVKCTAEGATRSLILKVEPLNESLMDMN